MKKKRSKRSTLYKLGAKNYFYYAISNGGRIYTDEDAVTEYKNNYIRDPKHTTYINLYVNGILQPTELYSVSKGVLYFESENPPEKGTPIVLQFVKLFIQKIKKRKRIACYTE